jgi:hypothetical protein
MFKRVRANSPTVRAFTRARAISSSLAFIFAWRNSASFAGFMPADDPRLSVLGVLDEPRDPSAGATAAPIEVLVRAPDTGDEVKNRARVSGDGQDPDLSNNDVTLKTTVTPPSDEFITFCPPGGCTFDTGTVPTQADLTSWLVPLGVFATVMPVGGAIGVLDRPVARHRGEEGDFGAELLRKRDAGAYAIRSGR